MVTSWRERLEMRSSPVTTLINVITTIVVGIIVVGIVLVWADANRANDLVDWILDAGSWLTTPFHDMFTPDDHDVALFLNWGLAAIAYWAIGGLLAYVTRRRVVA